MTTQETNRKLWWTKHLTDLPDGTNGSPNLRKYPDFFNYYFKNSDDFMFFYGTSKRQYPDEFDYNNFPLFASYFACDLEWAKNDSTICKPETDKFLPSNEKSKFTEKYPCLDDRLIGKCEMMTTTDGKIYRIEYKYNNEDCWLYLVESQNPQLIKKYYGLIEKQNGSDFGNLSCE